MKRGKGVKRLSKAIIIGLLSALMLITTVSAEKTGSAKAEESQMIQVLKLINVVSGDENGNLNLESFVTRAEFIKMVISASKYNDTNLTYNESAFHDVSNSHWASGYIQKAKSSGLVNGYPDGTFMPEQSVCLEEAVTICLRLLGYNNTDFVGAYPVSQMQKYENISLNEGVSAKAGEYLTRYECMQLIYNVLNCKTKNNSIYCTELGYSVNSDNIIDYFTIFSNSMKGPCVVTDDKSYLNLIPFDIKQADIFYDGKIININEVKVNDILYYIEQLKSVWVYKTSVTGVCTEISPNTEHPTSVTVAGKKYSLNNNLSYEFSAYGSLSEDMLITLVLDRDGTLLDAKQASLSDIGNGDSSLQISDIINTTLKGPFVTSSDSSLLDTTPIDIEQATVYKNNEIIDYTEIKKYNVYYYSEVLNSVWIYDDAVSGTIDAIAPSTLAPTSVTISGVKYNLDTTQAKHVFSNLGEYKVGDRVTLLLNRGGAAIEVLNPDEYSPVIYGIVLKSGTKSYADETGRTYSKKYVTVYSTSGTTYTYQTISNVAVGQPVKVIVYGDTVSVTKVSSPTTKSSALDLIEAVKNNKFAADAEIIDYYNASKYGTVHPSRISGNELSYSDVIYFTMNENGEVEKLILNDYTGDLLEYGVILSKNGSSYTYLIDDAGTKTFSSSAYNYVNDGGVCFDRTKKSDGTYTINKISSIYKINIIEIVDNIAITEDNRKMLIDDDVKVFLKNDGAYRMYKLSEFNFNDYYKITAYYDDDNEKGGRIRVIEAY